MPDDVDINPGSAIASLWLLTNHDHHPVSTPQPLSAPLAYCPRCHQSLHLPSESWIRQSCSHCGWMS